MIPHEVSEAKLIVYNKTLDTNLWNDKLQLDPLVRKNLLQFAQDFYDSTDLQGEVVDVFLIGSSANYNWTPESDLDVHVIIDISKEGINPKYARKFMDGLTWGWNSDHEIEVKGHPVETYLQDQTEPNGSEETARPKVAIFSLMNNEWIQKPVFGHPTIDKDKVKSKFRLIKSKIEKMVKSGDYSGLKALMKRIKNYRNTGLKERGEFSTENLVFKALRHTGMLEKLKDGIQASYDKSLSLDEAVGDKVFIVTGMTAQDLDVAGEKYGEGEPMVTHGALRSKYGNWSGSSDWRYRSDINTLFWWSIPDDDEKQATLDWLERKYNVRKPRQTTAQGASDELKAAVHYPWMKKGLRENTDPDRYYVVGVITDDLNVIAKRYDKRENYITHDQLRTQYGADWGEGASLWRYHSYGNWIFWWNEPSKEQKEEVLAYLHRKFGVSHPKHETDDSISRGNLREVSNVGKPFLIVGLVNRDFEVYGKKDYGTGDAIGSHKIEHGDFDNELRGRFSYDSPYSHWRYKSKNNTLYWWVGDVMNDDLLNVVLDYLHTKWNIKNPKIDRNKYHYFEDAHFVYEIICEGSKKDWVFIGNIDDDLKVNHVKRSDPELSGNHSGEGKRWRFRTTLPYIFWWEEPTEDERNEVEYYLYKNFGYKVKQHRNLNDYDFSTQAYLHGNTYLHKPKIDEVSE